MSYFSQFLRRCVVGLLCLFLLCLHRVAHADASSATLYVTITDPSGAVIASAHLTVRNTATGQEQQSESNRTGASNFAFLRPGNYQLTVSKAAFANIVVDNIVLNVGDERRLQLVLKVGSSIQNVTVDAGEPTLNTTDAAVGTVVDRTFVEKMPLNGRSFQDLISMTPGVTTQSSQAGGSIQFQGDFSVNGQRTESNYYTVDGVSGNIGAGYPNGTAQNATSGSVAGSTALGTTQSLVSVDALQEFRVTSSTYSAEYGRSPGGQFSLVTRSGTNSFHGSLFEYLRNDLFDANDWFNDYNGVRKTALRQNDFGGTIGGPVTLPKLYSGHDRTFFFVSYEGLRLVQPTAATLQYVPSLAVRASAPAAMQPLLNAFPVPTGSEILTSSGVLSGLSPFVGGYSLPATIDSTSVRVDQKLGNRGSVFFRYSDTPTATASRTLSTLFHLSQNSRTYTGGADIALGARTTTSLRLGFANSTATNQGDLDSFGGATPANFQQAMGAPASYSTYQFYPYLNVSGVGSAFVQMSKTSNRFRQWNVTDTIAHSIGKHQLKFGIDVRRFDTTLSPAQVVAISYYYSRAAMLNNSNTLGYIYKNSLADPLFNEFSAFVQDEWRAARNLSISAGVRWEVNPPPSGGDGPMAYTALGDPLNASTLTLAPRGTPLWHTTWYNFAPRLGIAWTAHSHPGWETIIRTGAGVFYDTGSQQTASGFSGLGFQTYQSLANAAMPYTTSAYDFSTEVIPPYTSGTVYVYPQHMQLPYTWQWNTSVEQALGRSQALTMSYVGSSARRLIQNQQMTVTSQNPNFGFIVYYPNGVSANYNALQVKFQHSIAHGLQSLVSYTWSHSLDDGSTSVSFPLTYGNSNFDVRHNLQAGMSWDIPWAANAALSRVLLRGWGVDGRLNVRSGFPITLLGNLLVDGTGNEYYTGVNYNPANPVYLYGSQYPGGRIINGGPNVSSSSAAFALPSGSALGNAARNSVRAYGADQVNVALRREIYAVDRVSMTFRVEAFNVLNQPNFGYIDPTLTDAQFGLATKMLNSSLGSMSSLFQQGGARSMQFSLRMAF